MRILLVGTGEVLASGLIARFRDHHELLCRDAGDARELVGCQTMIHLWTAQTASMEDHARAAGIKRIIRVVGWEPAPDPEPGVCIIRLAPLIGPGDPQGTIRQWHQWVHQANPDPQSHAPMVDHRDALGGIEGAMWKGKDGVIYPLVGPCPMVGELQRALSAALPLPGPGEHGPGQPITEAAQANTESARRDLGWWHRTLQQSLNDTVAGL